MRVFGMNDNVVAINNAFSSHCANNVDNCGIALFRRLRKFLNPHSPTAEYSSNHRERCRGKVRLHRKKNWIVTSVWHCNFLLRNHNSGAKFLHHCRSELHIRPRDQWTVNGDMQSLFQDRGDQHQCRDELTRNIATNRDLTPTKRSA